MAVKVELTKGRDIATHNNGTKWIADNYGNLVVIGTAAKAEAIYAATTWVKAWVTA